MPEEKLNQELDIEFKQIELAKKDPAQFAPLYEKYYKPVYLFVHKRTMDSSLTADLTSEVFFKALKNLPKYQFKGFYFSSWLYRIAINELNEAFRKQKIRRAVSLESKGIEALNSEMGISITDEEENIKRLKTCISLLREDDIQLIEFRYFEEKSFKEIGYILDITETNAKVKTYRVLDKIKSLFFPKTNR